MNVTDLAVARGGVPVLEGVSFTLSPGQALVLRGPNGIGKTTLLRTVAGLQPPLSGQIGQAAKILWRCGRSGVQPAASCSRAIVSSRPMTSIMS